ncbi:MAG: lysophospholipid acyltransferase family protein [Acutalibacteraceae bacterium]
MSKQYGMFVRKGPPSAKKFDMTAPPIKQKLHLMIFVWFFTTLRRWAHLTKVHRVRMKGVKPPYILLCNHSAFVDFYIMSSVICPHRGCFPAAVDDFIGREYFLRRAGGVPKRKFTADINLLRQCKKVLKDGGIYGIYVEARYSLCGVTEVIPDAVGQLLKRQGVPVVTLKYSGHHIFDPFWGNHRRRRVIPFETTLTQAFTPEELKTATVDEINAKIRELLYNDDFKWQSENRVKVTYKKRAEGLHKVLYQCPNCMAEYKTDSKGAQIFCRSCGKSWTLNYYGELEANEGETEFKFSTDWYLWERQQVRKEIENGTYRFESSVEVNELPNSRGFIYLGKGKMIHDMNGFSVKGICDYNGEPFEMQIPAAGQYAVHIEYNYRFGKHRDCVDLNTLEDTWYVFPEDCEFSVTKISLATEEMFNYIWENKKKQNAKIGEN